MMTNRKDKEMYQNLFNETLSKLRLVLVATGNQDLMKAVAKVMFDFSDSLKENNLIKDKELKQCNTETSQN
ncbi:MAG: hypothetical protein J6S85_03760 [Methanobrevibacter sp.]|nr:hypothetical protein [Methanobrevibacter sp.]